MTLSGGSLSACPDTPVLHDDQHGTAVVVLAALQSAARISGVDLATCTVGQIGLGAAGLGIVRLLRSYGVSRVLGSDLSTEAQLRLESIGGLPADLEQVMAQADVVIATTGCARLNQTAMGAHRADNFRIVQS